jgi:hypothetical protein
MNPWVILPYDGSPVARAALRRAAQLVSTGGGKHAGVIVATAGVDPAALDRMAAETRVVAGPDVPLTVFLLHPGDPIGALQELTDSLPDATFAAPLGGNGQAPWYDEARRLGGDHTIVLFFLQPAEIRASMAQHHERPRVAALVGAVLRAGARLRRGLWAPLSRCGRDVRTRIGLGGPTLGRVGPPSRKNGRVP